MDFFGILAAVESLVQRSARESRHFPAQFFMRGSTTLKETKIDFLETPRIKNRRFFYDQILVTEKNNPLVG
jgi:hypothetical protein